MIKKRNWLVAIVGGLLVAGTCSTAMGLVVDMQGVVMQPEGPGATCVDLTGEYRGVRVEPSEAGLVPQICFSAGRVNVINVLNATFTALAPAKQEIAIKVEHEFPPGPNGKVMSRARLNGFFSTPTGTGVPKGDQVKLKAYFSQGGKNDLITEPFEHKVGDEIDSAVFDISAKKPYLTAGVRMLKAELRFQFTATDHKLTLPQFTAVSIDSGTSFSDKLDTLDLPEEDDSLTETPITPEPGAGTTITAPKVPDGALPEPAKPLPLPLPAEPKATKPKPE